MAQVEIGAVGAGGGSSALLSRLTAVELAGASAVALANQALEAATGENPLLWVNAMSFGAVADSTTDSSPGIRAAIAAAEARGGGTVYIPGILTPSGYYRVDKDPTKTAAINLENLTAPINIVGNGGSSKLVFAGQGNGGAWSLFRIRNCRNLKFLNLHLEMGVIVNPDPNMGADPHHLIHLDNNGVPAGSIENIEIAGCVLRYTRGDQVKLICETNANGYRTRGVWIHHNWFQGDSSLGLGATLGCRSCIQVQRNVERIWVTDNYFTRCNKAMLDFEPTGVGPVGAFKIDRNIFVNDPPDTAGGSSSISLSGNGTTDPNYYSSFSDNILLHGGMQTRMLDTCVIDNNIVIDDRYHANGSLHISAVVRSCRITRNTVRRYTASNINQSAILVQSGGAGGSVDVPSEVRIEDNDVMQERYASPMVLEGFTGNARVTGNRVYYNGPAYTPSDGNPETTDDGNIFHLFVRSLGKTPAGEAEICDNTFMGTSTTRACMQVSADLGSLGDLKVHGNTFRQAATALELNRGSTHTIASLSLQGNRNFCTTFWSSPGGQAFTPVIGGNKGSICTFEVAGTPEAVITAPVGSMAVDKTNGRLYLKTTGTGNTGWTQIT
jgi:hypothetical protein